MGEESVRRLLLSLSSVLAVRRSFDISLHHYRSLEFNKVTLLAASCRLVTSGGRFESSRLYDQRFVFQHHNGLVTLVVFFVSSTGLSFRVVGRLFRSLRISKARIDGEKLLHSPINWRRSGERDHPHPI